MSAHEYVVKFTPAPPEVEAAKRTSEFVVEHHLTDSEGNRYHSAYPVRHLLSTEDFLGLTNAVMAAFVEFAREQGIIPTDDGLATLIRNIGGAVDDATATVPTKAMYSLMRVLITGYIQGVPTWPVIIPPRKYEPKSKAQNSWADPVLPDLPTIIAIGRQHGYSIALHGSMKRDCDLIAVPWTFDAAPPQVLLDALMLALDAKLIDDKGWVQKPHGRQAITFRPNGWVTHIDLSVMPRRPHITVHAQD